MMAVAKNTRQCCVSRATRSYAPCLASSLCLESPRDREVAVQRGGDSGKAPQEKKGQAPSPAKRTGKTKADEAQEAHKEG